MSTLLTAPLPSAEPHCLGPVWQKNPDGSWKLPEITLGWEVIGWIAENLLLDGEPIRLTLEQMRFVLWMYALRPDGRFLYTDMVLQRMKGWGKDPLAAVLAAVEFVGPCRFSHWATEVDVQKAAKRGRVVNVGDPIARDNPSAWVQIVAVSQEQTKNTAVLLAGMFTKACIAKHGIDVGKEKTYAYHGARRIEIASSAWRSMEGNRPTFVIRNETHHWRSANEGHELQAVTRRNLAKGQGGQNRGLAITNAYSPGEDSVAQRQREAYLDVLEGRSVDTGVLYDSLEAPLGSTLIPPYTYVKDGMAVTELRDADNSPVPPSSEVIREHLRRILEVVRGDALWLDIETLTNEILNGETSQETAKRFYFNSISLGDDASFDSDDITATIDPEVLEKRHGWEGDPLRISWLKISPRDPIVIFGDGSKSNDSTGLVGCRVSDGYLFTIGVWKKPPGDRGRAWMAPREEIDMRVRETFSRFNVVAFWFDPSHTKNDEDSTRYWDGLVDAWHQEFGSRLVAWAQQSGDRRSAVGWDMTSPARQVAFVEAVERFTDEMESHALTHDGHPDLVDHLRNARRNMTAAGLSVSKISRSSKKKIDLAVCAIGARMLRRVVMNLDTETKTPAKVWWAPVD